MDPPLFSIIDCTLSAKPFADGSAAKELTILGYALSGGVRRAGGVKRKCEECKGRVESGWLEVDGRFVRERIIVFVYVRNLKRHVGD